MVGRKGTRLDKLDKAKKKDFAKNKPKEIKNQTHVYRMDGDKCTRVSEEISLSSSSISKSVKLQQKFKFQEREQEEGLPRTVEIVRFFHVITL